ncbi:MAG TPA: epoxyalkane--coenzyme M transferase, partial [Amycolatopsis sp.]|nr:epoxyalkane--coenzyme M transferase [Amycolatopsis sp.]
MTISSERIITSHVGSLPRPAELIEQNRKRVDAGPDGEAAFADLLADAVVEVLGHQHDIGVDLVNDGEFGHVMTDPVNYGAWWVYAFSRFGGIELTDVPLWELPRRLSRPGEIRLTSFGDRRDRILFADAYNDPDSGVWTGRTDARWPVCREPLTYIGAEAVQRDIANVKAAMAAAGVEDAFLNAVAPGSCARFANEYYETDEEFVWACAEVMREEYKAIVDAGLILQLDDPGIAENWDQINPAPSVADYRKFTMVRIEALNHAIRDLPPERIRFHLCWGSWHGPHVTDLPMRDL